MMKTAESIGALANIPQEGMQEAGGVQNIDLDTFMEYLTVTQGIGRDNLTPELVGSAIKNMLSDTNVQGSLMSELGNRMVGGFIE